MQNFLNNAPSFTELLEELKGLSDNDFYEILYDLAVNGKNGNGLQLRAKTNRLRKQCQRALDGYLKLMSKGFNFRESIKLRQKPITSTKINHHDLMKSLGLNEKLSKLEKETVQSDEKAQCYPIPSEMTDADKLELLKLICRNVTYENLAAFLSSRQTPFSTFKEDVEDEDGYGWYDTMTIKRFALNLSRLNRSLDPRHRPISDFREAFSKVVSEVMKSEEKTKFSAEIPWLLSQQKDCYLSTLKEKYDVNKLVLEKLAKFPLPTKIPQLETPLLTKEERKYMEYILNINIKDEVQKSVQEELNFICKECCDIILEYLDADVKYPYLSLVHQSRTDFFSKYPELVLVRYVMDSYDGDLEIDQHTCWLIFISSLISATPNDAKIRVAETDYYKLLCEMRRKFLHHLLEQETPPLMALIIAASLRNPTALQKLFENKKLHMAVLNGSLNLFYDVSLLQMVCFRNSLVMNELFWVDSGSPDAFNAFWPIASSVQKLLQTILPNINTEESKTNGKISYEEFQALTLYEKLSRVEKIRGTNLRVVINAVRWMPEDFAVNRACRASKIPMERYFPWYQFLMGDLTEEQKNTFKEKILSMNPTSFELSETKEVFQQQMLAKFGFTHGTNQFAFKSGAAKVDNFNRYVKTRVSTVASKLCREEDLISHHLKVTFFDFQAGVKMFQREESPKEEQICRKKEELKKKMEDLQRQMEELE